MSREYTDTGIRINRSQRRWHKYGNKILAVCIAAAAIIAIIAIAANVGKGGNPGAGGNATTVASGNTGDNGASSSSNEQPGSETSSGENTETAESTTETSSSDNGKGGTLTDKPAEEEFSSGDFYDDSVFIGDIFVYGIDEYEYIDSSKLYSATFMTAAKAMDLTGDVASQKPAKIFVMLGFDECNLREGNSEAAANSIIELLSELKDKNPQAKIYAVSEIPVTEQYDENGGDYVTQEALDEINSLVKSGATAAGIGYIDVAESLKDGKNMSSDYSTDGCHVMKQYYPFVLNGIAKTAQ